MTARSTFDATPGMTAAVMFELEHPVADPEPLRLNCTRGEPAPPGLAADALTLLELPEGVLARFNDIVGSYLRGEPTAEEAAALEALCNAEALSPERLVPGIKAARFLVRAAATTSQGRDGFSEDLARLDDDPRNIQKLVGILLPCLELHGPALRQAIAERSLADHGNLVADLHWRIDRVVQSEHGDGINLPVAVLTFDYLQGERSERVTLQLMPDQLAKLKAACLRLMPEE